MAKLSTEATIGLGAELLLAILERLHIREPLFVWGLFALGLLLIADSIVRGEWAEKIADPVRRRKKRIRMGVIAGLAFALFGWWVFVRMQNPSETQEVMVTPPHAQPQRPEVREKTPPVSISPTKPTDPTKKGEGTLPAMTQDCGGGNCAASVGQQGGITAGQINVDTDRHLSLKQIANIGAAKTACATMPFINVTASSDEAKRYAYQIIGALHAAGCHADLVLPIPGLRPNIFGVHVGVRDLNKIDPSAAALGDILSNANVPFSFDALEPDFFPGVAFVLVVGAKESPTAANGRAKSPPKKAKSSAHQQQFCEGGNCAQSSGQSGGITAGQIKIDAEEHVNLSDLAVTSLGQVSRGTCPIQNVSVTLNNANDETGKFGERLKLALEGTGMHAAVGSVMAFGANGPIPRGVVMDAGDNCLNMANNLAQALVSNNAVSPARLLLNHVTAAEWKDRLSIIVSPPN